MQEVIAKALDIEVGKYYHLSDSMHVYSWHYEKMEQLLHSYVNVPNMPRFEFGITKENVCDGDSMNWIKRYLGQVEALCKNVQNDTISLYDYSDLDEINHILVGYKKRKDGILNSAFPFDTVPYTDLKVSMLYWWKKNMLKKKDTGLELIEQCIEDCKIS
jgi:hypothetical protein